MSLGLLSAVAAGAFAAGPAKPVPGAAGAGGPPFADDIAAFEAADKVQPPPKDAVLFVGSSSIRFWRDLAKDFPGTAVINRGFGGSTLPDVARYADRIVIPYRPREIVLYAGDNDVAEGRSPEQILADYEVFVAKVEAALPRTPIVFISIKPSPARAALVEKMRQANALVRRFCEDRRLGYVDVFTPMLDARGRPRGELFGSDGLHMNATGYALWTRLIAPRLRPRAKSGR